MSIRNHEVVTHDYTFRELDYYIPLIVTGLKTKVGIESAISTPQIIEGIHKYEIKSEGKATKIRPERIRMMVRYIVVNDLLPGLISGGKGYYVATTMEEMRDNIKSLEERETAIRVKRKAIISQMERIFMKTQTIFE